MLVLGINAYSSDTSTAMLGDGQILAAVEEERFTRIKHSAGFPAQGIRYCAQASGKGADKIEHIAICRDPQAHFMRKVWFALKNRPSIADVIDRLKAGTRVWGLRTEVSHALGLDPDKFLPNYHRVEHHRAHISSAFYASPFEESAVLSLDGFGDFVSAMWGVGRGTKLDIHDWVEFPHSLGVLYTAITQYLGLPKFGDEYKTMALAAYGSPSHMDRLRDIVAITEPMGYRLDLSYFSHASNVSTMQWREGEPVLDTLFSEKLVRAFGQPPRQRDEEIKDFHTDVAASLQKRLEEIVLHIINQLYERTKMKRLCIAGGVALNCTMNSKILENTPFEELYIQPAAWDGGTSLGAALYVWHHILGNERTMVMDHAYWGPSYERSEIKTALDSHYQEITEKGYEITEMENDETLCSSTAARIAEGDVVGWFQGRTEYGPRALGNRSILADPRRANMRNILNERIKIRETFRPFAPSILEESVGEYYEHSGPSPFMLLTDTVRPEKRDAIPAVVHVDGTSRIQTVSQKTNPLYHKLIKEFASVSGVPVVLNTSFNENEPIVCTPGEALECFLRTKMDTLVLGNFFVGKPSTNGKH